MVTHIWASYMNILSIYGFLTRPYRCIQIFGIWAPMGAHIPACTRSVTIWDHIFQSTNDIMVHIWVSIYECSYMDVHIWTPIYVYTYICLWILFELCTHFCGSASTGWRYIWLLSFGSLVLRTCGVGIRSLYTEIFHTNRFIYGFPYMCAHIWTNIYDHTYMV